MADIINTARGTANILENRVVVNMSDVISMLEPDSSPLLVLTKRLATKATSNYKFEWMEEDPMGRWTAFAGTTEETPGTELAVTAGTGAYFAVHDLLKNIVTGEIVRITDIDTDTLTVVRAYGTTAAANMTTNDKLLLIGNAIMQGAGSPAEKYNNPVAVFNYTQIFRTPFSVTRTLDKTKLYGGDELARLRKKKAIEHAKSIEYAFLFGEKKLDVTGAQPVTTTAGVYTYLAGGTNNVSKSASEVVEDDFLEFCKNVFTYGSSEKVLLASSKVIAKINSWAQGKLQLIQADKDKTYGLNIVKYVSPFGELNIVKHPLLVNGYDGYSFALDMEELKYRPLAESDTKLRTNIQANDEDGERDEYLTEAGLELRMPQKHGMFIITA
jgi:hypothetical protein